MDNLDEVFITAFKEKKLLDAIYKKLLEDWQQIDSLTAKLVKLHNRRDIDLITSFSVLKNVTNSQVDFFMMRRILEKSLPELDASVLETMNCVIDLVKEAGQDMAAGTLLPPFVDFCAANNTRPQEALAFIEKVPEKYVDLLPQVIMAGARLDIGLFLGEAIRLTKHDNIEIRRRAVFSLGKIEHFDENDLIEKAISSLESSVEKETDDHLLSGLVDSAFNLCKISKEYNERITKVIDKALFSGDNYTLHSGAVLFGLHLKELPDIVLDCLLVHLLHVKPENKGSLEYLDHGIAALFEQGNWKAIDFLEKLLIANPEKLSANIFDSAMRECFKNRDNIFNRLMTRWFIKGSKVLCEGVREIANLAHENNIQLAVATSDFDTSNSLYIIFLARKSVGYLFSTPVTAASIIVSLIQYAASDVATQTLINLLFDFLMINYPGKVGDYLTQKISAETGKVRDVLETVTRLYDDYLESIKSTGVIPELHPPQSQRDRFNRRFSRLMTKAMEDAQKESVFLSLVSKSVLLYGMKSINYVYDADGQANRMEFPLYEHSTEMEFPRLMNIDPFGLDYILRIFRAEQIAI